MTLRRREYLIEADDFAGKSREELEYFLQMYKDNIDTKKKNRETIPQSWLDKMQSIKDRLSGEKSDKGFASNLVFGHPQETSNPKYSGLIPIVVKDSASVLRFIDRAQKELDSIMSKIGKAESISKGRAVASKAQKKEALKYLSSANYREEYGIAGLIKDETLPELYRLLKVTKEK